MADALARSRTRVTQRDLRLLAFIAEHGFVLAAHAQAFLGTAPHRRLRALSEARLLRVDRGASGPASYRVTRRGLTAVGRSYGSRARPEATYRHDVGLTWLWLAARAGRLGPVREIVSERAMRSHDFTRGDAAPLGVRTLSFGRGGFGGLHHPDLLLTTPSGKRIAVELELSAKGPKRLDPIITGYALDHRIDAVLYLVESRAVGEKVIASARRAGISDRVHVQLARSPGLGAKSGRELDRNAARGQVAAASRASKHPPPDQSLQR